MRPRSEDLEVVGPQILTNHRCLSHIDNKVIVLRFHTILAEADTLCKSGSASSLILAIDHFHCHSSKVSLSRN